MARHRSPRSAADIKPLVAFSGTVKDPDTAEENTENSLNGLPPKVSIVNAFKTPEYRVLIVANKFQTGFDEPFLHTMYVDKKLGGVNAVQTLSRLNRTRRGKNNTMVLDFVNEVDDIQKSFQDYYPDQLSHCYGCGRLNEFGHQIKSYWDDEESICHFQPEPYHIAVPGYVYGGLIAALIDCHGTGTASAAAYRKDGRSMDSLPALRFLTASLHVDYLKPTPLSEVLELRGIVEEVEGLGPNPFKGF